MTRKKILTTRKEKTGIDKFSLAIIFFFGVIVLGALYWNCANTS
jgi:uncharacterized Rmd1/YagE family protein